MGKHDGKKDHKMAVKMPVGRHTHEKSHDGKMADSQKEGHKDKKK